MKFDDLPEEIRQFKDKFGEAELTHFWDQPMVHTGGFSPSQLWQSRNEDRKQEVVALLKR